MTANLKQHLIMTFVLSSSSKTLLLSFGLLFAGEFGKADDNVLFCGESWPDAYQNCHKPCPSGDDSECGVEGWSCYGYTGCWAKWVTENTANSTDKGESDVQGAADESLGGVHYCGINWSDAANSCSKPCPGGPTDCDSGEDCFVASNCARPIRRLESEMIMSLLGAQGIMSGDESGVMEESIFDFLDAKLKENQIGVKDTGVTGQKAIGGEGVRDRWLKETYGKDGEVSHFFPTLYHTEDDDYDIGSSFGLQLKLNFTANQIFRGNQYPNEQSNQELSKLKDKRYLPATSSALDVSMVITGEYRPPPYLDMDLIIANSINYASETVLEELRERGKLAGSSYFERVEDMRATSAKDATPRPTPGPTQTPTITPSSGPTRSPSSSPTRAFEQRIQTGYGASLYDGTARSFGIIFEVKTTSESPTIAVQGFEIYSSSMSTILYEVWTKEGTWQGFEGKIEEFTKVGEGEVKSAGECTEESLNATNGECTFTTIPFNELEAVQIFGGGATRSFYITLQSREILYSRGISPEGSTDMAVMSGNIDIEILEGAGVLMYPFDQATDSVFHYRKPRGFLGTVHYHRSPCADGGLDEDGTYVWPCETRAPVNSLNTETPTNEPTMSPSTEPSGFPSRHRAEYEGGIEEMQDDVSPAYDIDDDDDDDDDFQYVEALKNEIILDSDNGTTVGRYSDYKQQDLFTTHLVLTLSGVPDRIMNVRETLKYQEILLKFLRSQEALSNVSMDVVGVKVWYQNIPIDETKDKEVSVKNGGKIKIPNTSSKPKYKFNSKGRKMMENIFNSLVGDSEEAGSVEVTTIIQSTNCTLPPSTASKLLLYVVQSLNSTLLDTFHYHNVLFSYFEEIDELSSELIDQLTMPPTLSPIHAVFSSVDEDGDDVENVQGHSFDLNIYVATGMGIATLWCILTVVTLRYLAKERDKMANDKMLFGTKTFARASTKTLSGSVPVSCDLECGMTNDEILAFKLLIYGPSSSSPWDNVTTKDFKDIQTRDEFGLDRRYRPIRASSNSAWRKSGNVVSESKRMGASSKTRIKRKSTGDLSRPRDYTRSREKWHAQDKCVTGSNYNNQDSIGALLHGRFSDSIAGKDLNSAFGLSKSLCETDFHRQSGSMESDAAPAKQSKTTIKRKSTGDLRRPRDNTRSREKWHAEDRCFSGSRDKNRDTLRALLDASVSDSIAGKDLNSAFGLSKSLCETDFHKQSNSMDYDAASTKQSKTTIKRKSTGDLLQSRDNTRSRENHRCFSGSNDISRDSMGSLLDDSFSDSIAGKDLNSAFGLSKSLCETDFHWQSDSMESDASSAKQSKTSMKRKSTGDLLRFRDNTASRENAHDRCYCGSSDKDRDALRSLLDVSFSNSIAGKDLNAAIGLSKSLCETDVHRQSDCMDYDAVSIKEQRLRSSLPQCARRKSNVVEKNDDRGESIHRNPPGEMRGMAMRGTTSERASKVGTRVSDSMAGKNITGLDCRKKSSKDQKKIHERLDNIILADRRTPKEVESIRRNPFGEVRRDVMHKTVGAKIWRADPRVSDSKAGENVAALTDLMKSLNDEIDVHERQDKMIFAGRKTRKVIKREKPLQRRSPGGMHQIVMQRMRASDSKAGKNMTAPSTDTKKSFEDKGDVHERLDSMVAVGRGKRRIIKRTWDAPKKSMEQKPPGEKQRNLSNRLWNVRASKTHSRVSDVMAGGNTTALADLRGSLKGNKHILE